MQTIQVKVSSNVDEVTFSVNNATIGKAVLLQHYYLSELKRRIHPHGCRQELHYSRDEAVQFVKDCITAYFEYAGTHVEFVD